MKILKEGVPYHFTCSNCGCEFATSNYKKAKVMINGEAAVDYISKCPECETTTKDSKEYVEEEII